MQLAGSLLCPLTGSLTPVHMLCAAVRIAMTSCRNTKSVHDKLGKLTVIVVDKVAEHVMMSGRTDQLQLAKTTGSFPRCPLPVDVA